MITLLRLPYISRRQLTIRMYRNMRFRQVFQVSNLLKDIDVDPVILGRPGARAR